MYMVRHGTKPITVHVSQQKNH